MGGPLLSVPGIYLQFLRQFDNSLEENRWISYYQDLQKCHHSIFLTTGAFKIIVTGSKDAWDELMSHVFWVLKKGVKQLLSWLVSLEDCQVGSDQDPAYVVYVGDEMLPSCIRGLFHRPFIFFRVPEQFSTNHHFDGTFSHGI